MEHIINQYKVKGYEKEDRSFILEVYDLENTLLLSSKAHTKGEFFNYLAYIIKDKETLILIEEIYDNKGLTNDERISQFTENLRIALEE